MRLEILPNAPNVFLQYCNELSMSIELDSTLAQAEVLFLSFSQLIADIDRREAEEASRSNSTLRQRGTNNVNGKSAEAESKTRKPIVSEELRELLKSGQ